MDPKLPKLELANPPRERAPDEPPYVPLKSFEDFEQEAWSLAQAAAPFAANGLSIERAVFEAHRLKREAALFLFRNYVEERQSQRIMTLAEVKKRLDIRDNRQIKKYFDRVHGTGPAASKGWKRALEGKCEFSWTSFSLMSEIRDQAIAERSAAASRGRKSVKDIVKEKLGA